MNLRNKEPNISLVFFFLIRTLKLFLFLGKLNVCQAKTQFWC